MENILVTGGAGFIGSHVIEALLNKGSKVICIDNFNDYYDPLIKRKNISEYIDHQNFKLYENDICSYEDIKEIFKSNVITSIIHLAARAGIRASIDNPLLYQKVNIGGTLNLLELAKEFEITKFIFASSSSVYGEREGSFDESEDTDSPISPYAATKKAGELLCYTYNHLYGINISCLRFFTVYGPRGRPDMAPLKFTRIINEEKEIELYGDGTAKRDFTYVGDIVDGIISAYDKISRYNIFNLGNSNPITIRDFISLIEENLGKKAKIKKLEKQKGDVSFTCANINKARQILNFSPNVGIEEGVKKMIEWYKKF